MKINSSYLYDFRNQSVEWFGSDNEYVYEHNLKNKKKLLEENNLVGKNDIRYVFNEHGFRSENFLDNSDSICFLGASCTFGTGLKLEDTYAYIVSKELNLRRYNLALGGASGCTSFRLALYWLKLLKPKITVYMSPLNTRLEIIEEDEEGIYSFYNMSPQLFDEEHRKFMLNIKNIFKQKETNNKYKDFYEIWAQNDMNGILLQQKNNIAIEKLARDVNSNFILLDCEKDYMQCRYDLARDLMHSGVKSNILLANRVLELIS
jgi:hypothetical protein